MEITARMLEDGKIQSILRDVSARRRLEEQLRQSSKMEAVGQLAGGVAHDFNNLLTAILGGCGFLLDDPALGAGHRRDVEEIKNAARARGRADQQLLAFSRSNRCCSPKVLHLNTVITGVAPLLRRLIGENVAVTTALADGLPDVRADRSQLEQVIINLCVNARDAMPKGGTLTIATEEAELDDAYVSAHADVQAGALRRAGGGRHRDRDGCGHTLAGLRALLHDQGPAGMGTGLGLATVYGIVKQSGGFICGLQRAGARDDLPDLPAARRGG